MPFEEGHKSKGGRPKGVKNGEGKFSNSSLTLNKHSVRKKKWQKPKYFDQAEIDYYINNDLPLDDYLDSYKLPANKWDKNNKKIKQDGD